LEAGESYILFTAQPLNGQLITQYIPAVTAVCLWCGRPLFPGLQTWEDWSEHPEYQRFPFVPCDDPDRYITRLRWELAQPRRVVRIVGLSGLGKTHLALEVCRLSRLEVSALPIASLVFSVASVRQATP
ncbi:MAG TPA: hypothetical protein VIH59_31120, partial [Candidatus Tectomicrobia bacterium]